MTFVYRHVRYSILFRCVVVVGGGRCPIWGRFVPPKRTGTPNTVYRDPFFDT